MKEAIRWVVAVFAAFVAGAAGERYLLPHPAAGVAVLYMDENQVVYRVDGGNAEADTLPEFLNRFRRRRPRPKEDDGPQPHWKTNGVDARKLKATGEAP